MRPRLLIALALVVLLAIPGVALGKTDLDPDDTAGPLDVVAARAKHFFIAQTHPYREWAVLNLKLITYETWTNDQLGGIDSHVTFEFDLDGDGTVDRCLEIRRAADGDLEGRMYTVGCEFIPGEPIGKPKRARRPDGHSLEIEFRKRWLGQGERKFRWRAVTSYDEENDSDCPRPEPLPPERRYATCTDFTRWLRHSI